METEQMIKEVIIVEGRDDIDAVNKAVRADVLATHGYGIRQETLDQIRHAYQTRGIIIFTDPDIAGTRIRQRLRTLFPEAKHAYLTQDEAKRDGDIGIENAKPDAIRKALRTAQSTIMAAKITFTETDMIYYGLVGGDHSSTLRNQLGRALGIGYGNGKTFLKRLNSYDISREQVETALKMDLLHEKGGVEHD